MKTLMAALLTVAGVTAVIGPAAHAGPSARGSASPHALCQSAISAAERGTRLPPKLLVSIGTVESGRRDPVSGTIGPWPWTINVAGAGYFFESKPDAIAAVERFRAAGVQSIDVGCMQVNLVHHAGAFASLDHAFDPQMNASYAADFLGRLYRETADWPRAAAAYHSRTPDLASKYLTKIFAVWPLARQYGAPDTIIRGQPEPPRVDPYGVYTREFAARLSQDVRDRAVRDAMMRDPASRNTRTAAKSRSYRSAENRQYR